MWREIPRFVSKENELLPSLAFGERRGQFHHLLQRATISRIVGKCDAGRHAPWPGKRDSIKARTNQRKNDA